MPALPTATLENRDASEVWATRGNIRDCTLSKIPVDSGGYDLTYSRQRTKYCGSHQQQTEETAMMQEIHTRRRRGNPAQWRRTARTWALCLLRLAAAAKRQPNTGGRGSAQPTEDCTVAVTTFFGSALCERHQVSTN